MQGSSRACPPLACPSRLVLMSWVPRTTQPGFRGSPAASPSGDHLCWARCTPSLLETRHCLQPHHDPDPDPDLAASLLGTPAAGFPCGWAWLPG